MTAILAPPGLDLSWVTFADAAREDACCFRCCSAQAACRGVFEVVAVCAHGPYRPYCVAHRDHILRLAAERGPENFRCGRCPASSLTLLRMEPLT
jgi:hypothetical protein